MRLQDVHTKGIRFIHANKECLEYLTRQLFDPEVICHEGHQACPRLSDVIRFMERNFEREEVLIRLSGYSAYQEHKNDHSDLLRRLKNIQKRNKCGEYDNVAVANEINAWLKRHTAEFDHDFIEFWSGLYASN